ncbi:2-methoxy-6-polyprenyl-1,4-benzoquinol methylase, mitochondrial-like [Centruroides sculpturatus]|uniref:2-methoxy-6-polyprenyl-1,4-benzoquinol methylase, mitochondrial-like n=1 Tax=Centruroides sculpturatus TaxID=218467 RepID=UPI000C6E20E0|nr:2-methoxy-6-polyprenyl-1,4-benzoquinol methylase, mitochondrial-like [Centruroides sculpturatus]
MIISDLAKIRAFLLKNRRNLFIYYVRNVNVRKQHWHKRNVGDYSEESTTHFGFDTVTEKEKSEKVYSVFSNVASKYDLMNDVMSGGIHRLWKDELIQTLNPIPGTKLLDVAGGTGDIAFRFLKYSRLENQDTSVINDIPNPYSEIVENEQIESDTFSSQVVVCDINSDMLNIGKERAKESGFQSGYDHIYLHALTEAFRVLKKGGRFLCLEFSQVQNPLVSWLYDKYSFQVIPVMGQVIARDWRSYQYLVESIRQFPSQFDKQYRYFVT